jgi:hypothetical protein
MELVGMKGGFLFAAIFVLVALVLSSVAMIEKQFRDQIGWVVVEGF